MTITRTTQADLYAYTASVTNARNDYNAHPTRACRKKDCDHLHDNGLIYCRWHQGEADRRAAVRAARRTA